MGSTREEDEIAPDQEIDFCTLGMFIVGQSAFTWLSPPPLAAFVSISYSLLCVHVLQVAGERYQSHSCGLSRRALESHFTPFYFCPTPWASQVNGQWNLIIGILFIYYKPESIRSSRNDIFTKLLIPLLLSPYQIFYTIAIYRSVAAVINFAPAHPISFPIHMRSLFFCSLTPPR
jgi:hypothetical protein